MAQNKLLLDKDNNIILRCYNSEMRAKQEDNKGIIEGYAIIYDSETDLGYFREVIKAGALKNTNLKDVRFLVNHNTDMIPLARSRNNNENSTMQLIVDSKGLFVRIKLDIENNAEAKSLYSAIERGDISGMSFMFTIREEFWEDENTDHPKRTILDIEQVFEVSAVTFPAYESTEINARCKTELDSFRSALERAQNKQHAGERGANDIDLLKLKIRTRLNLGGKKE